VTGRGEEEEEEAAAPARRPVIHRDIKSANLLLVEAPMDHRSDVCVKIADFGLSKDKQVDAENNHATLKMTGCGSMLWMAPEILVSQAAILLRRRARHSPATVSGVDLHSASIRWSINRVRERTKFGWRADSGVPGRRASSTTRRWMSTRSRWCAHLRHRSNGHHMGPY
jgi:serine/threonine protein kinase